MGQQATTMLKYDRTANERNAIQVLQFAEHALQWYRLDDGIMGGQSESKHTATDDGKLIFQGIINTQGGGFTSIRAPIPQGILNDQTVGIKIKYRGDGKTYKFIMSDGNRGTGGPFARSPSWQVDLPTTLPNSPDEWHETVIDFQDLLPNFGGGMRNQNPVDDKAKYNFNPSEVGQMGLMLSLKLSNGKPNPPETFGEGIFPFSLEVSSIEPVLQNSEL